MRKPCTLDLRTVCIPVEVLDRLRPHAERRGIHPNQLVRDLIETVVDEDLVDSVLDDISEAA